MQQRQGPLGPLSNKNKEMQATEKRCASDRKGGGMNIGIST